MKKKMVVFYSLMFLPLVVVLIALQFLPELIPAHYDMNNQVTRWGSKYETLIFPVITVLFGYFMLAMAKLSSKQEENGSNNKNVCIVTGIASLALFNAMTFYFLYADFNSIENLSSIALDLNQLVFGLLGVAMHPVLRLRTSGLVPAGDHRSDDLHRHRVLYGPGHSAKQGYLL